MADMLRNFGEMATGADAYYPFLAAIEAGKIDPETVPTHKLQEAASMVRNGAMPTAGAVVDLGKGELGAYDHVFIEHLTAKEAVLAPAPKEAIDDRTGAVKKIGGLAFSRENGSVRLPAVYDRPELADWRPETYRRVGNTAIKWQWDAPHYDILAIDEGFYIARRPMRIL